MAQVMVGLVAVFHVYFFVLERFLWRTPKGRKVFGLSQEKADHGEVLAANQGVYNLVIALGLLWTLAAGHTPASRSVTLYLLLFVMVVGIYGAITVTRKILWVQFLPALIALVFVILEMGTPRINDVSTTQGAGLPKFSDGNTPIAESTIAEQQKYYPYLRPLPLELSPSEAFALVLRIAKSHDRWTLNVDSENLRIEGSESSRFFRFRDEFIIEVRPEGSKSTIHMRSRSRLGKSDFGVNAQRIRGFWLEIWAKTAE